MVQTEKIIEGNKLIAEFMGWKAVGNRFEIRSVNGQSETCLSIKNTSVDFANNWNDLMPVVEKIWKMEFLTSLNFYTANGFNFSCEMKIYRNGIGESEIEKETNNPIETVWQTVVQFIEWYNETKLITQA